MGEKCLSGFLFIDTKNDNWKEINNRMVCFYEGKEIANISIKEYQGAIERGESFNKWVSENYPDGIPSSNFCFWRDNGYVILRNKKK